MQIMLKIAIAICNGISRNSQAVSGFRNRIAMVKLAEQHLDVGYASPKGRIGTTESGNEIITLNRISPGLAGKIKYLCTW